MVKNKLSGKIDAALSPDSIPILIPNQALEAIGNGYYDFVELLAFPQEGTGGVYTQGVFADLLKALSVFPLPGDKRGHSDNPSDDFFTIGGLIDNQTLRLRIRVPEKDYLGNSNEGFLRSLKTGNQKLSLVLDVLDNGKGEFTGLASYAGLRNDAVGTLPAMQEQQILANKEQELLRLVEQGKTIERNSAALIVEGKVNLIAVRNIHPLDNKTRNRILNAAAKQNPKPQGKTMNEEEIKSLVGTTIKEAVPEIIKEVIEGQQKEAENKKNAASVEEAQKVLELAKEVLGEEAAELDSEGIFQRIAEILKQSEEAVAEMEANRFVGAPHRKDREGKDTALFTQAKKEFMGMGHRVLNKAACNKQHEALKSNEVFITLRQMLFNPVLPGASSVSTDGSY